MNLGVRTTREEPGPHDAGVGMEVFDLGRGAASEVYHEFAIGLVLDGTVQLC
jgi:hypothetical protein